MTLATKPAFSASLAYLLFLILESKTFDFYEKTKKKKNGKKEKSGFLFVHLLVLRVKALILGNESAFE